MIQTASARPFVAEVWVRSRPSSCVISGTRSGPGTRFPPSTSVSPVGTTAPMPHVHIHPDMSSEGRADEAWRPSNKAVLFRILGRPLVYRMSSHFLTYSDICQALVCPPPTFPRALCSCSVPRQQNTFAASSMAGKGGMDFVGNCFLRTVACLQNPF